jgi:serine/threonine-protein kinase
MVASSLTNTKSIRTLPKWIWWLGIIYMSITAITYIGAFPIRYNQLLQIQTPTIATIQIGVEYLGVVVLTVFGFLLVIRRPNEAIAVLVSVTLVASPPNFTGLSFLSTKLHPIFYIPCGVVIIFITAMTFLSFISLPDGYPKPRWMLWLLPPFLTYEVFRYLVFFVFGSPEVQALRPAVFNINFAFSLLGIFTMIWRYRNHATPIQRQQFKWLFLGVNIELAILTMIQIFRIFALQAGIYTVVTSSLIGSTAMTVGSIVLCITLTLSISRYGLWDIDLTINRSVVAGFVTISLIVLFGAIFWLTQTILRNILGSQQSEISVAISALVVGGAFNPIRQRIRTFVDRRLYGFRFDLNQLARYKTKADVLVSGALTGQTLGGYQLMEVVGRGNMGEVYKGIANNKLAAIKIMQTNFTLDETTTRHRFEREGKIVLEHPNIVQTLRAGEENGVFYIVMEYVEGVTLKELLIEREHLPLRDIQGYLRDLAGAIDYAHAQGYVHRDIKPSNIMFRSGGTNHPRQIMLMDFGIAKILGDTTSLTGSAAVGTIDYMAPEQIKDSTTVDYRADIYALGVVLYETLTGVLPFKGNLAQVLFAHVNQPAPDIRQIRPDMPLTVSIAIQRALQKDPSDRFQTAIEFIDMLTSEM